MLNESVVDSQANLNFKSGTDIIPLCSNAMGVNLTTHQQALQLASQSMQGGFAAIGVANAARAADLLQITPTERATASSTYESGQLAGRITELAASVASMQETLRSVIRIQPQVSVPAG